MNSSYIMQSAFLYTARRLSHQTKADHGAILNFKPETWFDNAGNFGGNKLHVVERYTRTGADTLRYEATIEDPEVFERPWNIRVDLGRHTEPNFQLLEHECERDTQGVYRHPPQFLK